MRMVWAILGLVVALMATPAFAGDAEVAAIKTVLAPGPLDTGLFSAEFLRAVPPDKLSAVVEQIKTQVGPVVAVEPRGGQTYAVETASYEMITDIVLAGDGKI